MMQSLSIAGYIFSKFVLDAAGVILPKVILTILFLKLSSRYCLQLALHLAVIATLIATPRFV